MIVVLSQSFSVTSSTWVKKKIAHPSFSGANTKNICYKVQILDTRYKFIKVRVIRDIGDFLFAAQWIVFHGNIVNENIAGIKP